MPGRWVAVAVFLSSAVLGQQKVHPPALEFPVVMQQNVTAGITAVGTPVQAKLVLATLVDGVVIPDGAIFSGTVVESASKTDTSPSRLAICMESVKWKDGSQPAKIYLTAWYYPFRSELRNGPGSSGLHGEVEITFGGHSSYPPGATGAGPQIYPDTAPDAPLSALSSHRILMKDVDSSLTEDGTVIISSTHHTLKLDKTRTYVLAAGTLVPAK
ncbi:MAG TPA: hypothetical protein VGF06_14615 [Terriglobales bacterium]|jgi:hypothetical protein